MNKPTVTGIERELTSVDIIVSKSDEKGNITYVSPIFIKISGYTQGELLGKPHSILRHPDMPKAIFRYLWSNIKEGKNVMAYVKNLCENGDHYWVIADIKVGKNPDGSFRNYMSTRRNISTTAKNSIAGLYTKILDEEKTNGDEASYAMFDKFLVQQNINSIDDFNQFMQKLNK